jgi:N-acyl-L-homoserine lactone synthetase
MEDERERALVRMDEIAHAFIARVAPVSFSLADTSAERETTFRLRAQAVLDHGWAQPEDVPIGIERDRFDDRATHIAGWDGARMVATARLVVPIPGDTLPTEEHFEIADLPTGSCANLDRMVVDQTCADPGHRIFLALAFQGWIEMRKQGFNAFLGVVTPGMLRLYRRLGLHVTPVGAPRVYWGEERLPCLFDPVGGFTAPGTTAPIAVNEWASHLTDGHCPET